MAKRTRSAKIKPVQVLVVDRQDADGHLWAWGLAGKSDPIEVWLASGRDLAKLSKGDRALTRIGSANSEGIYVGEVMKALPAPSVQKVFGKVEEGWLLSSDKRDRKQYKIVGGLDHEGGELVVAAITRSRRAAALEVEIIEVLGHFGTIAAIAPLTLAEEGIPVEFPPEALAEAAAAKAPTLDPFRTDLRDKPFVTIDGEDAKDFDDAVFAKPDPKVPGGWIVWVAIADVAGYVRPASALDKEARKRGNSVYLPDTVVPMLPESLSNGWCSLVPNEDRACLAVRLHIDGGGQLKSYKFVRGLMRSHARLTYTKVQAHMEGQGGLEPEIIPHVDRLAEAYALLRTAREKRGTLDLDMPERRAVVSEDKTRVLSIAERSMGPANQLIEEMMILANVAAARAFGATGRRGIYRVHDEPDRARIEALSQILKGTPAELPDKIPTLKPRDFARILHLVKGKPYEETVKEQVLRTQSMAVYDLTNIGHFGLALQDYSHFTSPIRRYSDLMAHRALIDAFGLGSGGQDLANLPKAGETATHISETERRAQMAERRAHERYVAAYHSQDIDSALEGRVTGLAKAGLFIRLDSSGGDLFVPVSLMGPERFDFDAAHMTLSSRRTGQVFALGDRCRVQLLEASPHTGSLMGQLIEQLSSHALGTKGTKGTKGIPTKGRCPAPKRKPKGKSRKARRS